MVCSIQGTHSDGTAGMSGEQFWVTAKRCKLPIVPGLRDEPMGTEIRDAIPFSTAYQNFAGNISQFE